MHYVQFALIHNRPYNYKYIVTVPKEVFWPDIMEHNPFQQQGQINSEALHVPKNLYTWILLHVFCVWIRKKKWSTYQLSQIFRRKQTFYFLRLNFLFLAVTHTLVGGGVTLRLWRYRGCKAPKTSNFQSCCHPMTPFLLSVSAVTQWTPFFLHSAATGSYFLFQDSTDQ